MTPEIPEPPETRRSPARRGDGRSSGRSSGRNRSQKGAKPDWTPREQSRPGRVPARGGGEASLDTLVGAKEIVVACGPGGVGKTTTAAALAAMTAIEQGGRILVLTIDPARRLADALGLDGIGNQERRVPPERFSQAGVKPRGELWAAMLDTAKSWDDLVRRHAPDPETVAQILANPLYRNISGRFVQSHDYIAMERLFEIHASGAYDLIVVDTPPTRNAIDFLEAPQRMAEFFSSRLLRWLIAPYRSRLVTFASRPFYQIADRVLGTQFLSDVAEFFILFQTMYAGFVERAQAVGRLLRDRRTTFLVVATLEAAPLREAEFFASALDERHLHLGAMVLNKVLPDYLRDRSATRVAEHLRESAEEVAEKVAATGPPALGDREAVARVLRRVASSFLDFQTVARHESEQRKELATSPDLLVAVPYFDSDIYDLEGLIRLGRQLWA